MAPDGVLVVVPTYEERGNIEVLLRILRATVPGADVLVVDDGSPDGTADVAEALGCELGGIHLLRRAGKGGLGSAYRDGFAWARHHGYGTVVQMDADLSHDPLDLPALLAASAAGADLVVGSRYRPGGRIEGWPWPRHLLSWLGNAYASVLLRLGVADSTSGYRVWRGGLLDELARSPVRADGYGFQVEMVWRAVGAGAVVVEVPIGFVDRMLGASKLDRSIILEAAGLVVRLAFTRPLAAAADGVEVGASSRVGAGATAAVAGASRGVGAGATAAVAGASRGVGAASPRTGLAPLARRRAASGGREVEPPAT